MTTDAADRAAPGLDIDPFSAAFLADPYPDHARMRDAGPVVRLTRYGIYAMAPVSYTHLTLPTKA